MQKFSKLTFKKSNLKLNCFNKIQLRTICDKPILSIDVGTKNFAYCQYDPVNKDILKWGRKDINIQKQQQFIPAIVSFLKKFKEEEPEMFDNSPSIIVERQVRGNMRIIEGIIYAMFNEKAHIIDPKRVKQHYRKLFPQKKTKELSSSAQYRKGKEHGVFIARKYLEDSVELANKNDSNEPKVDGGEEKKKTIKKLTKFPEDKSLRPLYWKQFLESHKKKDDLSDSFLQAIYFAQYEPPVPVPRNKSDPKTKAIKLTSTKTEKKVEKKDEKVEKKDEKADSKDKKDTKTEKKVEKKVEKVEKKDEKADSKDKKDTKTEKKVEKKDEKADSKDKKDTKTEKKVEKKDEKADSKDKKDTKTEKKVEKKVEKADSKEKKDEKVEKKDTKTEKKVEKKDEKKADSKDKKDKKVETKN